MNSSRLILFFLVSISVPSSARPPQHPRRLGRRRHPTRSRRPCFPQGSLLFRDKSPRHIQFRHTHNRLKLGAVHLGTQQLLRALPLVQIDVHCTFVYLVALRTRNYHFRTRRVRGGVAVVLAARKPLQLMRLRITVQLYVAV